MILIQTAALFVLTALASSSAVFSFGKVVDSEEPSVFAWTGAGIAKS